jgi:hypothetical protein
MTRLLGQNGLLVLQPEVVEVLVAAFAGQPFKVLKGCCGRCRWSLESLSTTFAGSPTRSLFRLVTTRHLPQAQKSAIR